MSGSIGYYETRGPYDMPIPPRERLCFLCALPDCLPYSGQCLYQQIHHPSLGLDWVGPLIAVMDPGEVQRVTFRTAGQARRAQAALYCAAAQTKRDITATLHATSHRVTLHVRRRDNSGPILRYRGTTSKQKEARMVKQPSPDEVTIQIASLDPDSVVNGPGRRVVVFVQGCPIQCPGCQNARLWPEEGGVARKALQLAHELIDLDRPVTISGGEPFAQPIGLFWLVYGLRYWAPRLHLIVYSGYALEDLIELSATIPEIRYTLSMIDVLVDGPFIAALDDDHLQYRGSRNQHPIDIPATLAACPRILHPDYRHPVAVVVLDWDTAEITITPHGDVVGAAGVVEDIFGEEAGEPAPMCGQIARHEENAP